MSTPPFEIRALRTQDRTAALDVINEAARWYREFLPPSEHHEPEMTAEDFAREAKRAAWFGAFDGDALVGVMALERVEGTAGVALLRHAYISAPYQRRGVGRQLGEHLERVADDVVRFIVGTYAANYKARHLLEQMGYRLSTDSEAVLRAYYDIPEDRLQSSVTYEKEV